MTAEVAAEHPKVPLKGLCELFFCEPLMMATSWYYQKQSSKGKAERDIELKDVIEQIVLEFPSMVTAKSSFEGLQDL
jgi:hypothetical protein